MNVEGAPPPSRPRDAGAPRVVDVASLIDARPIGRFQIRVLMLCGFAALLDGLDLQSIGLAAPSLIALLHVAPRAFGAVFSAALLGLMLGAFVLGPMADRIGRKLILIGSAVVFGVFTICTAQATSFPMLLAFRFLTGLGLGGAMPSFISLGSEYVPQHRRTVMVALLWAGFPAGGVLGGVLASYLIPTFGWQSVFYVGGILPLVLALVLAVAMPESIGFLVARGAAPERIARLVGRITGSPPDPRARFVLGGERVVDRSVKRLFSSGRAGGTALLWADYFLIFLMLVTNTAWSPILLHDTGIPVGQSGIAMAGFNLGSVVGTLGVGFLLQRFGVTTTLTVLFVGSAASLGSVGLAAPSFPLVTTLETLAGLFLGAGSSGLIALAAVFYPTTIRSTGVGWATAAGRLGSFCGPLALGALVGAGWGISDGFLALGTPAMVAAALTLFLSSVAIPPAAQAAP